ncbi:hypothetical protein [Leifsonia shinshuensis]|uniref:Uncharacterized protein n=1 Tax=Leifsonia shinshuensis TaxID=150026 RepID=A0A7G6YA26_9MICO|nr:hypothetical protein [Leifsonia shinshuensis]QNE35341.1 hypothetical protein F1C12_09510 [Leifsonia shinshuensis]
MRALINAPVVDIETKQQLIDLLEPTGWLVRPSSDEGVDDALTQSLLEKFSPHARTRLQLADRVLIDVGNNEYGMASLENVGAIHFRVVKDNARHEEMQHLVEGVCKTLIPVLEPKTPVSQPVFTRIELLEANSSSPAASGTMQNIHSYGFRQFVRFERVTEYRLFWFLLVAFALTFAVSIGLAFFGGADATVVEIKGWVERISSAFLVSTLTSIITLAIQYQRWRSVDVRIEWS